MAVYPISQGGQDYASNSLSTFAKKLFSAKVLTKFYASVAYPVIANTDYEGEIKNQGDSVVIRTKPTITIRDYVIGQKLISETPISTSQTLQIDKGKYYDISINDIQKFQSDLDLMNMFAEDAAQQTKISIDTSILNAIYASSAAANIGATAGAKSSKFNLGVLGTNTPVTITPLNVLNYIIWASTVLGEQNIPVTDRWMVIPEVMWAMLMQSDLKNASITGDPTTVLRNGSIGRIANFNIFVSNNLNTDANGNWIVMFGHKSALTFAAQITKQETLKNQDDFGDILRGLVSFGYKIIKSDAIGYIYATF